MILTAKQQEAADEILGFFLNDEPYLVLSGFAGVGKSTVIQTVTNDYLKKIAATVKMVNPKFHQYDIRVTATTNKAVDVLQTLMPALDCTTIHSALSLIVRGKGLAQTRKHVDSAIYIIDEASMINEDLFHFINLAAENYKCKFLFVGDPTQLPPVGETHSSVFTRGFPIIEMTEIMRQAEGPLRELCEGLRKQVLGEELAPIELDGKELVWLERDDYKKAILTDMLNPQWVDSMSKALCFTNNMAIAMNRLVKTKLTGTHKLYRGDYAINNKSLHGPSIRLKTDALVYINEVEHDQTDRGVAGCNVRVNGYQSYLFLPYDVSQKALLEKRAIIAKDYDEVKYLETNWVDLRASYSCTVHKSQGSTYHTVYVDVYDIAKAGNFDLNLMHRLLYVAVSRASHKVVFTGELP